MRCGIVSGKKGQSYNIRAGCPNLIERLETGLLSYGSDMTLQNNPFECGLERFTNIDKAAEYMSREALTKIKREGLKRKMVNLAIEGSALDAPRSIFDVLDDDGGKVGIVTSLAFSTRFGSNLAFAMVDIAASQEGASLQVETSQGRRKAVVKSRRWD